MFWSGQADILLAKTALKDLEAFAPAVAKEMVSSAARVQQSQEEKALLVGGSKPCRGPALTPEAALSVHQHWCLCSLSMCSSNGGLLFPCWQLWMSALGWPSASPKCLLVSKVPHLYLEFISFIPPPFYLGH